MLCVQFAKTRNVPAKANRRRIFFEMISERNML